MDNDAGNVPPADRRGRAERNYPSWLSLALAHLRTAFPADRIEIISYRVGENGPSGYWRVKCLDCPGKLYYLGPGETLRNFGVHLNNRLHRGRVYERVNAAAAAS